MIEGTIAYHFGHVEDLEVFYDKDNINSWIYENGYSADEIETVPIMIHIPNFPDKEREFFDKIIELTRNGEIELT